MLFMTSAGVRDKFQITVGAAVREICVETTSIWPPGVLHVWLPIVGGS